MFCPNCGLSQAASETKFCSKCGFQLGGVVRLLSTGGNLPPMPFVPDSPKALSPRQKGMRWGAYMMLLTLLVVPIVSILTGVTGFFPGVFIPISAVFLFVGGLFRIIYAWLFEEPGMQRQIAGTAGPSAYVPPFMQPSIVPAPRQELGAGAQSSVPGWRRTVNTADLADPPSVTEHTTRLLTQDPESK